MTDDETIELTLAPALEDELLFSAYLSEEEATALSAALGTLARKLREEIREAKSG